MRTYLKDPKLVLKAAQSVWATNKYYVLACSQEAYLNVRQLLRPDQVELLAAYEVLQQVEHEFKDVERADLPQIENSLFHVAGYFKTIYSNQERQEMHILIQENPAKALKKLAGSTYQHQIAYLTQSRLWSSERKTSFNEVRGEIRHKGIIYPPKTFMWHGNSVSFVKKVGE